MLLSNNATVELPQSEHKPSNPIECKQITREPELGARHVLRLFPSTEEIVYDLARDLVLDELKKILMLARLPNRFNLRSQKGCL